MKIKSYTQLLLKDTLCKKKLLNLNYVHLSWVFSSVVVGGVVR